LLLPIHLYIVMLKYWDNSVYSIGRMYQCVRNVMNLRGGKWSISLSSEVHVGTMLVLIKDMQANISKTLKVALKR
jgi:hypothetical protein